MTAIGTDGVVHTLTTDDNGHYLVWLPSSASPFTVTASMPAGYFPASVGGIVVNSGGAMTDAPLLVLRKNVPCVDNNPAGVSISLPWGGTGNQTLTLTNSGPASSLFTITERTGGFTPMAPLAGKWLIVSYSTTSSDYVAITPILTALGYTYDYQYYSTFASSRTVANLLTYQGVLWLGTGLYESTSYTPNVTADERIPGCRR